jgi:hypothetical protein
VAVHSLPLPEMILHGSSANFKFVRLEARGARATVNFTTPCSDLQDAHHATPNRRTPPKLVMACHDSNQMHHAP